MKLHRSYSRSGTTDCMEQCRRHVCVTLTIWPISAMNSRPMLVSLWRTRRPSLHVVRSVKDTPLRQTRLSLCTTMLSKLCWAVRARKQSATWAKFSKDFSCKVRSLFFLSSLPDSIFRLLCCFYTRSRTTSRLSSYRNSASCLLEST